MGEFYILKNFTPGTVGEGGHVICKNIVIEPFNYDEKMAIIKSWLDDFGKKGQGAA